MTGTHIGPPILFSCHILIRLSDRETSGCQVTFSHWNNVAGGKHWLMINRNVCRDLSLWDLSLMAPSQRRESCIRCRLCHIAIATFDALRTYGKRASGIQSLCSRAVDIDLRYWMFHHFKYGCCVVPLTVCNYVNVHNPRVQRSFWKEIKRHA